MPAGSLFSFLSSASLSAMFCDFWLCWPTVALSPCLDTWLWTHYRLFHQHPLPRLHVFGFSAWPGSYFLDPPTSLWDPRFPHCSPPPHKYERSNSCLIILSLGFPDSYNENSTQDQEDNANQILALKHGLWASHDWARLVHQPHLQMRTPKHGDIQVPSLHDEQAQQQHWSYWLV